MTTTKRFALAISPVWRPALLVLGVTAKRFFIEVGEEGFRVSFGRLDYYFPMEAVEGIRLANWPLWAGIGARTNFRGAVGLVGTYVNVVQDHVQGAPAPAAARADQMQGALPIGGGAACVHCRAEEAHARARQGRLTRPANRNPDPYGETAIRLRVSLLYWRIRKYPR